MEVCERQCIICARQYVEDKDGDWCGECYDRCRRIVDEFKPLPGRDDAKHQIGALAATASNYRFRKKVVKFGGSQYHDELVRFYEHNREAVVKLRNYFGLYAGWDFWELEQKYDESICKDVFRKVYGGTSRQTVGELN